MNPFVIFLRIVHVMSAAFWVGGALLFFAFVEPAVRATAPQSQAFMQNLMVRRKFTNYMEALGLLTIVAGGFLIWRDSLGLQLSWILKGPGVGFSLGALMGISAALSGSLGISPAAKKLSRLGAQIQQSGTPPTQEQQAEMHRLDRRMALFSRMDIVLLILALLFMATARYWSF